jgi:predicted aminopeptidase
MIGQPLLIDSLWTFHVVRLFIKTDTGPKESGQMIFRLPSVLWLCFTLAGCESLGYYSQAASGQLSILSDRQPIEQLIEDPTTPVDLRTQLQLVLQLRAFAQSELLLPVEGQYSHYVDLERDYVVWSVFAAPELSLEPKTWCYPIAGCSAYRGYFSQQKAREYAVVLADQGYDTYVGGVAAYSTLGWLNDPVLSTFIHRSEPELADLIFHELAHQLLYVPGDTMFNESFATAVAAAGVQRWMQKRNNTEQYETYLESRVQQEEFIHLLGRYRERLGNVYEAPSGDVEKRRLKKEQIEQLGGAYKSLQQQWGDFQAYSAWMAAPINNARLNSVALYHELVPALERLLAEENYQLSSFYHRCIQLAELNPEERRVLLQAPLN